MLIHKIRVNRGEHNLEKVGLIFCTFPLNLNFQLCYYCTICDFIISDRLYSILW